VFVLYPDVARRRAHVRRTGSRPCRAARGAARQAASV